MVQSIDPRFQTGVMPGQNGLPSYSDETTGNWTTEVASAAALDDALGNELWRVHREVRGTLVQPRPGQTDKGMRIDRVLVPNARLLDHGWPYGIVGIEIKRSGEKVGPAIAQALDYSRTVWTLPHGFSVWLDYVFIWPMAKTFGGALESVCAQHRIGWAYATNWDALRLTNGTTTMLSISRTGELHIGKPQANGRKSGSR